MISFNADEAYQLERARAAIIMRCKPTEVEELSLEDVMYILAVHDADEELSHRRLSSLWQSK